MGHVPGNLGIDAALNGHQALIVHAEEYLYSYFQFHRDFPTDSAEVDRMVRDIAKRQPIQGRGSARHCQFFNKSFLRRPTSTQCLSDRRCVISLGISPPALLSALQILAGILPTILT